MLKVLGFDSVTQIRCPDLGVSGFGRNHLSRKSGYFIDAFAIFKKTEIILARAMAHLPKSERV